MNLFSTDMSEFQMPATLQMFENDFYHIKKLDKKFKINISYFCYFLKMCPTPNIHFEGFC